MTCSMVFVAGFQYARSADHIPERLSFSAIALASAVLSGVGVVCAVAGAERFRSSAGDMPVVLCTAMQARRRKLQQVLYCWMSLR